MKNTLAIVTLLILVVTPLNAEQFSLPPLGKFVKTLDQSPKSLDPTDIAYFANRCSVLLYSVGAYFTENGTNDQDRENGEKFIRMAKVYGSVGTAFDANINKRDPKLMLEQQNIFIKAYYEEIKQGKLSSNTFFTDVIKNDLNLALKYYETFEAVRDSIKKPIN
jgi:hypothetical protein